MSLEELGKQLRTMREKQKAAYALERAALPPYKGPVVPPLKYVVFAWDDYYPAGGLGDIRGSFDLLEDARAELLKHTNAGRGGGEILDRDTWEVLA